MGKRRRLMCEGFSAVWLGDSNIRLASGIERYLPTCCLLCFSLQRKSLHSSVGRSLLRPGLRAHLMKDSFSLSQRKAKGRHVSVLTHSADTDDELTGEILFLFRQKVHPLDDLPVRN